MKLHGRTARIAYAFGFRVLELWARTLRFEFDDRAEIVGRPANRAYILAIWHNRLLLLPYVVRRFVPARKPTALISASRDGAILTDMVRRFGFAAVRGSRSRSGASAILSLTEILEQGGDVAITPDGPRGPVYNMNPGVVFLAQKSGAPVLPVHMEFSRCWRLKNWDRFILPVPFSAVRVIFSVPHIVQPTSSDEEFEAERLRLQNAMMENVRVL